nr:immunoglobulin light chain junction region [Macaca mulatta]MOV62021.1 immunoglobulin light chain junction region [Macaca mulatta]MOV62280.1 immunoglobulin light chain junction region [Macaca mulatta]MOV65235.1 immunoglobulin light chain junction region [Macaca mulatta]MOV65616.1 immunoglobulin light chain junction region [Macaca mulatta]
CLQYKTRPYSF